MPMARSALRSARTRSPLAMTEISDMRSSAAPCNVLPHLERSRRTIQRQEWCWRPSAIAKMQNTLKEKGVSRFPLEGEGILRRRLARNELQHLARPMRGEFPINGIARREVPCDSRTTRSAFYLHLGQGSSASIRDGISLACSKRSDVAPLHRDRRHNHGSCDCTSSPHKRPQLLFE